MILTALFLHGWHPETINSVVPGGWSIAAETSFYLLLPLLFRLVTTRTRALAFLLFTLALGPLMNAGILLFSAAVLFTVVTLPVELNASHRAMAALADRNILVGDELTGAKKVLSAAALTYVAAALMAILQLLRMILISRR